MTKIKICGLKSLDDVSYVNQLLPDYAGFIFAEGRRRTVSMELAKQMKDALDPKIQAVGVFLNQEICLIDEIVNAGIIDVIQLHGSESEEYIEELRTKIGSTPVIKAFSVKGMEDIEKARVSDADMILLDNHIPGSGESFDWSVLENVGREYFLAGGLSADNVKEAIQNKPYAVDVSSGVESEGKKDYQKMKAFVDAVRDEENGQ